MTTQEKVYDVLIAGRGAAAYSAAMYAARYQIQPIMFGALFGGETAIGGLIENYPGQPEMDGFDLMLKFREQAEKYDVPAVDEDVVSVSRRGDCFEATTNGGSKYSGASLILAIGRERRKLGLEHEEEWVGRGVSYCSTCDAPLHRGNTVAVVGGGDAAIKGSVLLSMYAEKVYVVYRKNRFTRPEPLNLKLMEARPNVEPILSAKVVELKGDGGLSGVVVDTEDEGSRELALDGLFIEIGADPRVDLARQLDVELNELNEVKVDKLARSSVEGVFAAGDVADASGELKQTITAAAQGALAATAAYEYVSRTGNRCYPHAVGYSLDS